MATKPLTFTKVYVHKSASYPAVLNVIKDQIYGSADSTGLPVCADGTIIVQDEDGRDSAVEWTIETYMTTHVVVT